MKSFIRRYWFLVLAVILVFGGSFFRSEAIKWGSYAIGFAVISIGLGISGTKQGLETNNKIEKMEETLSRIENLQEEIRKEQNERANSGPPIVASLEAMSKYYMDYINKQRGEENK